MIDWHVPAGGVKRTEKESDYIEEVKGKCINKIKEGSTPREQWRTQENISGGFKVMAGPLGGPPPAAGEFSKTCKQIS